MELIFSSIKDAIRLKFFLTANGLGETLMENQGQFMYRFSTDHAKNDRYVKALTYFIKEIKRNEWLNDKLLHTYHYENEDERSHIIDIATDMFAGVRKDLAELAGNINENQVIGLAVKDLLSFGGAVLFESFSRFRLKPYYEHVGKYLEIAIDEYKMEQEYQMFVNMLRDYLQNRTPRLSTVHIYLDKTAMFYDENVQEIAHHDLKELIDQRLLANHPIYVDSAVIAPLLSIAPEKIYLYTFEEEQALVRTLRNIFEERISILSPANLHELKKSYTNKP
ncbi:putative sporulation protein YtxC [Lederbergia citrea]|uniref:Sporulation protein YtxC n=1 Tax=Lederbergia citrea TaxID=2833581 RepID=A0A942URI6_9BACI|nr:putative sporulation protein YtxC [Lederbergia citrea]MBS4176078.1 putative sporulation protein YtxC [Lederbergia citrea]MBS4202639.1 putative sporulation protein YtxC [Lederbergia citrea]MBS4222694.1 putative sporulation protein YtxC [Lederbergia citrea]